MTVEKVTIHAVLAGKQRLDTQIRWALSAYVLADSLHITSVSINNAHPLPLEKTESDLTAFRSDGRI